MKIFAAITKVDENDDGTLTVEGVASTEAVDSDGEVVKAAAIEAALPDFMRYGTGNLREMHQSNAAGTVDKADVTDGVTTIVGTVVDPIAVKKVKKGVYKGFSIGGRVTQRDELDKSQVTGVRLVEISLVDRPANPEAVISMWKSEKLDDEEGNGGAPAAPAAAPNKGDDYEQVWRSARDQSIHLKKADLIAHHKALDDAAAVDGIAGEALDKITAIEATLKAEGSTVTIDGDAIIEDVEKRKFTAEERRTAASKGNAMPDGSFPINDASDLENAVRAFGRAKNKAGVKRHIIRRAKALGATDKLPADWRGSTKKAEDGTDLQKSISLYSVANMLQLLACLDSAEESFEYDDFWSNQAAVPDELKTRFGAVLVEFGDIVAESLDVILSAMSDEESEEALARAEKPANLAKTQTVDADDSLTKMTSERDHFKAAFEKVATRLDTIAPQVEEMAKRLKAVEDQPIPPRTAGGFAISKEHDTIGIAAEPVITKADAERMLAEMSPEDRTIALIKISRENPLSVQFR